MPYAAIAASWSAVALSSLVDFANGVVQPRACAHSRRQREAGQLGETGLLGEEERGGDATLGRDQIGTTLEQRGRQTHRDRRRNGNQLVVGLDLGGRVTPQQQLKRALRLLLTADRLAQGVLGRGKVGPREMNDLSRVDLLRDALLDEFADEDIVEDILARNVIDFLDRNWTPPGDATGLANPGAGR